MSAESLRSESELAAFARLQQGLPALYRAQFADPMAPRAVIVVPSLSFDADELAKIEGVHHYEERMLCMLMLLRLPRTEVIYLTSQAIDPVVIDYHLHLLAGVPSHHARRRLHLFDTGDASPVPLSLKLLQRPRLLDRIGEAIADPAAAHMSCFVATSLERSLAVRLGVPLYGCDPELRALGTKSGGRELFREAGVELPDGFEHLRDAGDLAEGLHALARRHPHTRRAVVKLDEGFSGEGNATVDMDPLRRASLSQIGDRLASSLRFEAAPERWESYRGKLERMGGVVECFVEGADKRSPSVQFRIDPLGRPLAVSTHDQVLGGATKQIFVGCTFPADAAYRLEIQDLGARIAEVAVRHGLIGRFGVDFVSLREGDRWRHYAIEINLRKGGTTHPMMVLQFLTDGRYDAERGEFITPAGQPRFYYASDNVVSASYRGWLPEDIIDIAVCHGLHFHGSTQQGVVFQMIGGVSEFGKLGMVCIGDSPAAAERLRARTIDVLDEAARSGDG
jgi:hypothetical protein